MNLLSLFSGIGGLELGLERAGMTTVGQVEIDKFCRRVLEKHWPEVPRHDDVRTAVEWWRSEPRPAVDAICGGFPCQPVSLAGKGKAQEDERWLWPEFAETIRVLGPKYVIVENVPGLASRGLNIVLGEMADDGYNAIWSSVPAAGVGAPHLRRRIFIVAADANRVDLRFEPWRSGGQEWSRSTVTGYDGTSWALGIPESIGWGAEWQGRPHIPGQLRNEGHSPASVADTNDGGREEWSGWTQGWGRESTDGGPWAIEPDVGRVANGVPARVDRIRTLGNAVVPQVAEYIGHIVMAAERA